MTIFINVKVSNVQETEPPLPPPPTTEKNLAFTLADDLLPPASLQGMSDSELRQHPELWPFSSFRKPRSSTNIPATVTTYKKGTFTQSAAWLNYWASNCSLAWFNAWDYNELRNTSNWAAFENAWLWLTKGSEVITNKKGWDDGYHDPVSGQNKGSPAMGIDALLMERNVVELQGERLEKYGGILGYLFKCFDGSVFPPNIRDVNCFTNPELFHRANIMMGRDYTGSNLGINPFPQGWQFNAITPLPIVCMPDDKLSGGVNLVPENRAHLTSGKVTIIHDFPNPYNPVRNLRLS